MNGRIAVVTSSFPIRGDGSEAAGSFVADIVEELAKHLDVRVVAPGASSQREHWAGRIEIFRYAAPVQALSTLKPWRPKDLRWIKRVLRGGLAATRAAADCSEHILALWGLPCGEWARRVACERSTGYSVWLLGSDVWSLGRLPVARQMLSRVIRQAGCVYADGYKLAEDARGIAGRVVEFLPSTRKIDLDFPPLPRSQPPYRLLFLGRWHPNKGVDLLLDSLAMLRDEDWQAIERVEIQGGGPMEGLVRERVAALYEARRPVEVGGFLDKAAAETAISRADWLLIPSRIESIPVVFSDAMKLGRPVLATPVGDLPRLIAEYRCGMVCGKISADALTYGLRDILQGRAAIQPGACAKAGALFSLPDIAARLIRENG